MELLVKSDMLEACVVFVALGCEALNLPGDFDRGVAYSQQWVHAEDWELAYGEDWVGTHAE